MQELRDYESYRMTIREELKCLGISVLLAAVAAWILYKHPLGLFPGIAIFPI